MALNDQEESEWAGMLALYEKGVAIALDEIDKGRPQDAADALRQAEHEVHKQTVFPDLSHHAYAEIGRQVMDLVGSDKSDAEIWREITALCAYFAATH